MKKSKQKFTALVNWLLLLVLILVPAALIAAPDYYIPEYAGSAADDQVLLYGTEWELKSIGDCDDTSGKHLNYDTGTNAFSCGTSVDLSSSAATDLSDVTAWAYYSYPADASTDCNGTCSWNTISYMKYAKVSTNVTCFYFYVTTGATVSNDTAYLIVPLPIDHTNTSPSIHFFGHATIYEGSAEESGHTIIQDNAAEMRIYREDFSNFLSSGGSFRAFASGCYDSDVS